MKQIHHKQTLTAGSSIAFVLLPEGNSSGDKVLQEQELLQECQLIMLWTQSFQEL